MEETTFDVIADVEFFPSTAGAVRVQRLPRGSTAFAKLITSSLIVVSSWMISVRFHQENM